MRKNKVRFFGHILIAIFVFFSSVGCTQRKIKNTNSSGKNIICFGDSITFGYGVNPGESYPVSLAKLVHKPVINAGVDGDTSFMGLKRIQADVLDRDPYLVLVEFSGNDLIKGVPASDTVNNIREMIKRIQAKGVMVAVVDVSAGLFMAEYRLRFFQLARETGAIFIPTILDHILTNPSMKSDFMHPNASGYKIVAQRVYCGISKYIK